MPTPNEIDGRIEPGFYDDERAMVAGYLDYQRATLLWKASGLTQAQLAQPLAPSTLTIVVSTSRPSAVSGTPSRT